MSTPIYSEACLISSWASPLFDVLCLSSHMEAPRRPAAGAALPSLSEEPAPVATSGPLGPALHTRQQLTFLRLSSFELVPIWEMKENECLRSVYTTTGHETRCKHKLHASSKLRERKRREVLELHVENPQSERNGKKEEEKEEGAKKRRGKENGR